MIQYTKEERAWAAGIVDKFSINELSPRRLVNGGYISEFVKKFGRNKTPIAISTWLRRLKDPNAYKEVQKQYKERGGRTKRGTNDVFNKSNYVLFIPPNGIYGFDTSDEVVEGIKSSKVTDGISLFKRVEVKVSFDVSIK